MINQFLKAKTDTLKLTIYSNNWPIIPTAAYITLYDPAGKEIQARTAVTGINIVNGEMTYSLTAVHTADTGLNYKALWEYTYDGTDYQEQQLFDVVLNKLAISITDDDLFSELESLKDANKQATGTADSSTSSTLVDTERKESNNAWRGGVIEITSGTGEGQRRNVTAFVQNTSTFTISPNWETDPDTTSKYFVVGSYSEKIAQSFKKIEKMLYDKGLRHALIIESSQIEIPLIYLTISNICLDLTREEGDKWNILFKEYDSLFKESFTNMKLEYDEDESGSIVGQESGQNVTEIRIGRG